MGDRLDESFLERLAPTLLALIAMGAAAIIALPQLIVLLSAFLF